MPGAVSRCQHPLPPLRGLSGCWKQPTQQQQCAETVSKVRILLSLWTCVSLFRCSITFSHEHSLWACDKKQADKALALSKGQPHRKASSLGSRLTR